MKLFANLLLLCYCSQSVAFSPSSSLTSVPTSTLKKANHVGPLFAQNKYHDESSINSIGQFDFPQNESSSSENLFKLLGPLTVATLASTPLPAEAAQNDQIASAVAAYGHYLSLFVMVGALTFERFTVAPGMSQDDEKGLGIADALLGVSGVALLVSGYYRATLYGKGWNFYSHEPIFWLKMVFLCIFGAASLFPTITIIKRTVAIQTGKELAPMSEKLASRLKSIFTAELVMIGSIPLAATMMARGVLYTESIPFQYIGPAACAVTAGGLGYKYVSEALSWKEED